MKKPVFYRSILVGVVLLSLFSCGSTKPKQSSRKPVNNKYQNRDRTVRDRKTNQENDLTLSFDDSSDSKNSSQSKNNEKQKGSSKTILGFQLSSKDNIKLYQFAEEWYGTPHKMGGCSKKGIDCSCLVRTAYSDVYQINLSRSAAEMVRDISQIKKTQLKEGDLVFFKTSGNKISHVGIYLKDNKFVHTSSSKGVMISDLDEAYWKKTFCFAGRHKKL